MAIATLRPRLMVSIRIICWPCLSVRNDGDGTGERSRALPCRSVLGGWPCLNPWVACRLRFCFSQTVGHSSHSFHSGVPSLRVWFCKGGSFVFLIHLRWSVTRFASAIASSRPGNAKKFMPKKQLLFLLALFHTFPQPYQTNYSPPNSFYSFDLPQPHSNLRSPFE